MIKVKRKVCFVRRAHGQRVVKAAPAPTPDPPPGRIPRISRLMALAIHFEQLLRQGKVRDQSDLARLAHVTQPRVTQIMNLNHLAPDIQEQLLYLPQLAPGREPVHERLLRPVTRIPAWSEQRRVWRSLATARFQP